MHIARIFPLAVALAVAAACSSSSTLTTPLLGTYRSSDGTTVLFREDGTFLAPRTEPGRFVVDGKNVRYTLSNGDLRVGERLSDDVVTMTKPGVASITLYRMGSKAAQSSEAQAPASR